MSARKLARLGDLHCDFDSAEPFPVTIQQGDLRLAHIPDPEHYYRVEKMKFGGKRPSQDKTTVIYNGNITMTGIPLEAYDYFVNGKPALEWVIERQCVKIDKASGIVNDAIPTPVETPIAMPTQSAEAPARRIIKTSIDELLAAYAANQVAAAKKYGNASIQLEGRVVRVREALGSGILVLKSPISGETYEFGFSDEGTKMLESLKPGDRVSITCPTVLEAMSIVMIEGCSDVELK